MFCSVLPTAIKIISLVQSCPVQYISVLFYLVLLPTGTLGLVWWAELGGTKQHNFFVSVWHNLEQGRKKTLTKSMGQFIKKIVSPK